MPVVVMVLAFVMINLGRVTIIIMVLAIVMINLDTMPFL